LKIMNDDAFARLVGDEVKNKISRSQREFLNLPENNERWQEALQVLIANLDEQLSDLADRETRERERFEALGDEGAALLAAMESDVETRRNKITRFRFYVERRLESVQRESAGNSELIEERARLVEFLRQAIERHQSMIAEVELDPTPVDHALWAALNGAWEFDKINLDEI